MNKAFAAIALTLAFGILTPAKPHHHQEPQQEKVDKVSDTDVWRHLLLRIGGDPNMPINGLEGDRLTIITTGRKFRTEFEKAIDKFNAAQETRIEPDKIAALKDFIVRRDAMVESYKKQLMSALSPYEKDMIAKMLDQSKPSPGGISAATGTACGLPDQITCSITYSGYALPGMDANHNWTLGVHQILDGFATMFGNPPHARHTPTVTATIGFFDNQSHEWVKGTPQANSGKSVCADCYLYVNAFPSAGMAGGVQYETKGEGIVVCNEAGKFFDTDASPAD